ncbi:Prephenate dehydrogenase [uncultured archaeon]|nr:Prephenate dehydrogenase [uncultured archaeon]
MNLLVVGGTGDFGAFYASLFKKHNFEVFISSTRPEYGKEFCRKNGYSFAEEKDIPKMDFVVLSVPNFAAPENVSRFAPLMKKGSLLMDFCSVKGDVCAQMEKFKISGIELLSIHPMHGPRIKSIDAQQVVFIPVQSGEKSKLIEEFFRSEGANIISSKPREHDEVLSIVQGLNHFSQFVSAGVLKELGVDLKRSLAFGSPNYNLFLSVVSRVVLQNPELYAQIQLANPLNEKMRASFIKNAEGLARICKKNDSSALEKEIIKGASNFKDAEVFLLEGDRMVIAQKEVVRVLKKHIGKMFMVENLLTHNYHYGEIKEVTSSELIMLEKSRPTKINLLKLRLVPKEEVILWREKNVGKKKLDYSVLVDENVLAPAVLKALTSVKECVFEFIGEYKSEKLQKGKKSLTFKASFFADENRDAVDSRIKGLLIGLGYSLR